MSSIGHNLRNKLSKNLFQEYYHISELKAMSMEPKMLKVGNGSMEDQMVESDRIKNDYNDRDIHDIGSEFQSNVHNKNDSNGVHCFNEIGDVVDHNADDYDQSVHLEYNKNADVLNCDGDGDEEYDDEDDDGGSNPCVCLEDDIYYNCDNCGKDSVGDKSDMYVSDDVNNDDGDDIRNEWSEGAFKCYGKSKNNCHKSDNDEGISGYFTCEDIDPEKENIIYRPACGLVNQNLLKDDDEGIKTNNNRNIAQISSHIQPIKCCDVFITRQYEKVMETLEEYQAQSKWEKHKSLTSCLQKCEINVDLKIVLFLEQGMAEIMQKHFSVGKKLFRQALGFCSQSKNTCLLQGRALMFLGNAYRKEGPIKYGKAFKCLTLSQQILCLVESREDQAELNYFLGALYLNLLSISLHQPSQRSRYRIEKHYQAVYDYAMAESASRVREKVQRIFPLGMANFLLDGQTEYARSRVVPEIKLKKAEDCLKYFADNFPFDEQSVSMQTDYCKSKSDLEFRRGNISLSQDFLQKGLNITQRHGYHLEVQSLEKRLVMLEKCLPRVPMFLPQEDTADFADNSATVDSEINVFSSGSE